MKIIIKLTLLILFLIPALSGANTFYLDGEIYSDINMEIAKEIKIPQGVKSFSVYIGQIQSFSSPTFNQQILSFNTKYSTTPSNIEDKIDENGNKYLIARWENPPSELNINTAFKVKSKLAFSDLKSKSSFPLSNIPSDIKKYLSDSQYAQKNDPAIVSLSKKLIGGAKTQYEAVTNVLNWVVDNMKYTLEPPQYDALYSLKTGTGNCQNFSNLSVSLLRAAGIPARGVIGVTVKKNWRVKHTNDGTTRTFRGIVKKKIPVPPLKEEEVKQIQTQEIPPPPPIKPELPLPPHEPVEPTPPEKKEWGDLTKLKYTKSAEFGNLNFPEVIDIFAEYKKKEMAATATDVSMSSSFVVESAEYVTDKEAFAQSFEITTPMMVKDISLAMHKFGGTHGNLWVEIVEDKNDSPIGDKIESERIPINNIRYFNGYKWIPFSLERQKIILSPARYWVVLRYSGDAIFNWFYIYGNPYGIPDDTKSKIPDSSDWNNILSYDFNFRVRGTESE